MKKKFLLFALPAILLMSSCAALKNAENLNLKANDNIEYYQEDTLAHEELFGEVGEPEALKMKEPLRLGDPTNDEPGEDPVWTKMPKVGVQFNHDDGYYAVRFVAAIANTDGMTIKWHRAVSDRDGNQVKNFDSGHTSNVRYDSLKSGNKTISATSEGEGYQKYVVYTMYNIPDKEDPYTEGYIAAYCTLSKAGKDDVVTKVVATQIKGDHSFSFEQSQLDEYGFFLMYDFNNGNDKGIIPAVGNHFDSPLNHSGDKFGDLQGAQIALFRYSATEGFYFFSHAFDELISSSGEYSVLEYNGEGGGASIPNFTTVLTVTEQYWYAIPDSNNENLATIINV